MQSFDAAAAFGPSWTQLCIAVGPMGVMADKSQFVEMLLALRNADAAIRKPAETMFQHAKKSEPEKLIVGMLLVLASPELDEAIRSHDAVLLRQLVSRGPKDNFAWPKLSFSRQREVATELLRRFELETSPKVQGHIGDAIERLAEHVCDPEDPRGSIAVGTSAGECGGFAAGAAAWPELLPLVFRMANSAALPECSVESALRLLTSLAGTLKDDVVVASHQEVCQTLSAALHRPEPRIRGAAVRLACKTIGVVEKAMWGPFLQATGMMMDVLQQLLLAGETQMLSQLLQAFIDVIAAQPDFFKAQLLADTQPAKFMSEAAKARSVDSGIRSLALEWLVSFTERRAKWVTKKCHALAGLAMEVCMEMALEVEGDSEAELWAWAQRMADEEGEEDHDEMFHGAAHSLDRIARAIALVDTEFLSTVLFKLISAYAARPEWQARHAAFTAVRQTAEFVDDREYIDSVARVMLAMLTESQHPRVRFTAMHAIGQMANDQAPVFQEAWHQTVMSVLLQVMDDPVDRVAAMAMSAFVSFGEGMDNSLMPQYAPGFMEKLVHKLQTSKHRGVREESITCIAVIAGVVQKDFIRYYDPIMTMLKQFLQHAAGERENRLRGKSFECMSLLGIAVGKERFLPDAREVVEAMVSTDLTSDNVQREYIKAASERIAQCLKGDFALFLPALLPGLLQALKLEEDSLLGEVYDDSEYIKVTVGSEKIVHVRTERFQELARSISLIHTYAFQMGGAFASWVPQTAEALLPLLSSTDDYTYLCDATRSGSLHTWALLIDAANADEQGRSIGLPGQLLRAGLQPIMAVMAEEVVPETLGDLANGVASCIRNVGPGVLQADETLKLVEALFGLIDKSFARSRKAMDAWLQATSGEANLPKELGDEEEDDEDTQEKKEEQCRRNCEEAVGAVIEVATQEFLPCVPTCAEKIGTWISNKQTRVLSLYLACNLLTHLKEQSVSVWPVFMQEAFGMLADEDPDARVAAAYAINMAAPLESFAKLSQEAYRRLAQLISAGIHKQKKRSDKTRLALDHAVAAILVLAREKPDLRPPEVEPWGLALQRLPIRSDNTEARKIHGLVADAALDQLKSSIEGAVVAAAGVPPASVLGHALSLLAEVYHVDCVCGAETDAKILQVFRLVPPQSLQALGAGFTEKQQKKIEKMLLGS